MNQFRIQSISGNDVYQYDVRTSSLGVDRCGSVPLTSGQINITPEPQGSIVYKKAWNTKAVQGKLAQQKFPWLYDNRKLAW